MKNNALSSLTDTEFLYVEMTVNKCLSRKEVAEKLHRSEATVSAQQKNIYRKLGINKVTELSKLFFKGSLVTTFLFLLQIFVYSSDEYLYRRRYRREVEISQGIFIPTNDGK